MTKTPTPAEHRRQVAGIKHRVAHTRYWVKRRQDSGGNDG